MITKEFVLAGKAIFTVANPSGERYTYRVKHKPASDKYEEAYFVSLLTGPSNTSDYTYLGMLIPTSGQVRLTAKSHYNEESKPVKVLRWYLGLVWSGKEMPDGYTSNHDGNCARCGRLLTTPESVASGLGPICAGRMGISRNDREEEEEEEDVAEISNGDRDVAGLTEHHNNDNEITHWTGLRNGRHVTVFND